MNEPTPDQPECRAQPCGLCRWSCRGLIVVGLLHVGLWVFGILHPQALLKADRGEGRLRSAQAVIGAFQSGNPLEEIAHRGVIGDYVWHAILLTACGGWLPGVIAVQLLLHACSLGCVYKLVGFLGWTRPAALLAALLYALIPVGFIHPHVLSAEAIYIPLAVGHVALLVRYAAAGERARDLVLSGCCYAFAAVTRPEIIAWLPVAAAFVVYSAWKGAGVSAWGRVLAFVACCISLPSAWIVFQGINTGEYGFGRSGHDAGTTIRIRVDQVLDAASEDRQYTEPQRRSLSTYAGLAIRYPGPTIRIAASHAAKWMLFPSNLQIESYLGFYKYTGRRSLIVHDQGWVGALREVFAEMPILTVWLLIQMSLFAFFWVLVARGVAVSLGTTQGARWVAHLLILKWPIVYFALLLIVEGNSRKRSPADFVLAVFAAIAVAMWFHSRRMARQASRVAAEDDCPACGGCLARGGLR